MGAPQEPGRPDRLRAREPGWAPGRTAQARGWRARRPQERTSSARQGPLREGNEARREGRSGVGALRCTGEAGEHAPADPVEGRECRVREPEEGKMTGTPSPDTISTRLHRIAMLAREMPGVALRTLAQHIDMECLREAYRRTRSDGAEVRPIGIPTFEDKILQRAVTMMLEAVYEQGFLDCSYGFRPGRSAHQALEVLR